MDVVLLDCLFQIPSLWTQERLTGGLTHHGLVCMMVRTLLV